MLILWYFEYITVVKLSDKETAFKIVALVYKVCVIMESFKIILSEIPFAYVQEK